MARVADGARLDHDVEIGPFCTLGGQVELRAGVRLVSHVNVTGVTVIGERTIVYPFASLGTPPQSTHYRGSPTRLMVGSDCHIREGVTINTGSEAGGGVTSVGERCFFMSNSHIGHDCRVGSDVTLANGGLMGGHVEVADHVFVGGNTAVHQHVRIGEGAMIAGSSGVTADVIPFGFAVGMRAELAGLNVLGLKRRGFDRQDIHRLRRAYHMLFMGSATFAERLAKARTMFADDPLIGKILSFVSDGKDRSLMMAAAESARTNGVEP
jgi:UDP-N-acetylglucosamine acyltransferase